MRLNKITCLVLIVFASCIDRITIPTNAIPEQLVVDGMITDQPGPYTVKLFRTQELNDQLGNTLNVKNAAVVIEDNNGVKESLVETAPGNYVTKNLVGTIGKTYTLKITTAEGLQYESEPEKLVGVGDIRNITYSFKQNESPTGSNYLTTTNGFQIYVDADVLPEQQGRVRWRTTKTFEILAHPELRTRYVSLRNGTSIIVPDIPGCAFSGPGGNCGCCECWITDFGSLPALSNLNAVNNNSAVKVPVDFIPATRRIFNQKCHIEVEQLSVSESVYKFWSGIGQQKKTSSDLFQTPLPKTGGNIKALTPGAVPALGIFAASAVKTKSVTILRSEIPYHMPAIDTLKEACMTYYKYSTTTKPPFW
jgi:hypothetical protein